MVNNHLSLINNHLPLLLAYKALFWSFFAGFCALCAFLGIKNQFNQRLMNYLHAFGIFTTVEKALQIGPFCTNKPNFPDAMMNVSNFITRDYENNPPILAPKNKPNSKPIKAKTNPIQSQTNPIFEPI
ncbi:MAG: hypothetical protein ACYSUY_08350 [Planctomycetota bacterium]|jgi:hypothetical protein